MMATREQGSLRTYSPWPMIGWGTAAGIIIVAGVLGFGFLDRYQQSAPTLSLWNAICHGLGITADTGPASEPQPPLHTPTRIAWTSATVKQISNGNAKHGAFVAFYCTACHGDQGISHSALYPTLAGMDAAVIYKQLDDFRSGHRSWGAMNAIGQALPLQDSADVAAYFATQRGGLPTLTGNRVPEPGRSLRESDPAKRLIFAGDPERGIPSCSACHGPGGYKLGAPALQRQQASYIEEQLVAFAQGLRQNDVFEQMRIIARQLTPDEVQAVAAFYSVPAGEPGAQGLTLR
jgi:cytochrome c553